MGDNIAKEVKPLAEEAGIGLEEVSMAKHRLAVPTIKSFLGQNLREEARAVVILARDVTWRELYIKLTGKDPLTRLGYSAKTR
ncbi:MAG: hypothetical protein AB1566_08495 [Chloroflexota bacterium]